MLTNQRNRVMNICRNCSYRKEQGETTNRYGVGRCLPFYCNNPLMEGQSHTVYDNIKQYGDDKEWDLVLDE